MKKIRSISLVLSGLVLGLAIGYAPDIYGAGTKLLGSKVNNTVTVNLNKKKIGEAPVINGVSYLPVRALANELGLGVGVDGQEVNLSDVAKQEEYEMKEQAAKITSLTKDISSLKLKIRDYNGIITANNNQINKLQEIINKYKPAATSQPEIQDQIKKYETEINKFQKEIDDANKQLETLNPQLSDLESQLAELQK